jgi:ATP-dependent protease ClpP protease subunit
MNVIERLEALHQFGIDLPSATIFLAGEIDGNLATALRIKYCMIKDYYKSEKDPLPAINICINSFGGDANAIASVLDWYDEMKTKEGVLVNIQAEGVCMSAATFIVGGATGTRRANKRTRFMVHEMQIEGMGGTHTQTKAFQLELNRQQKECYDMYAQMSFKKVYDAGDIPDPTEFEKVSDMWEKLCTKETYFGAEDALKKGLIDEII